MIKNYIPTINISSLIKNNFETQSASKTIKEIEKALPEISGFFLLSFITLLNNVSLNL